VNNFVRRDVGGLMEKFLVVALLLVGCGGSSFEAPSFNSKNVENDAGTIVSSGGVAGAEEDAGGGSVSSGGIGAGGTGGDGSGGAVDAGALHEAGGASDSGAHRVPPPACCTDADCPATGAPVCSPWGTCYQGGDPYNCDYDDFCERYCVHCSGSTAGACVVTSAPGAAHVVKSCVCS
jgi:hypothetical protein